MPRINPQRKRLVRRLHLAQDPQRHYIIQPIILFVPGLKH